MFLLTHCVLTADEEGEEESVVLSCRVYTHLHQYKCDFCKCYFQGGSGLCNKCQNNETSVDEGNEHNHMSQRDDKRCGACTFCARLQRNVGVGLYGRIG